MMWFGRYGWMGGSLASYIMMAVCALVFITLLVLTFTMLIRGIRHSGRMHGWDEKAIDAQHASADVEAVKILDVRFAKGEINEEEYTKMREVLKKP
jgi:uncharacterized membrane protein